MFVHVRLLNGYSQPLLYAVPTSLEHSLVVGTIVNVPIRKRTTPALVIKIMAEAPSAVSFAIKEISALEPFPSDHQYHTFIAQLGHYYQIDSFHFIERIRHFLSTKNKRKKISSPVTRPAQMQTVQLTTEQQKICDALNPLISKQTYVPTLLHGVTGSGKTEIYKNLIIHALSGSKSVVLLLPEVTLALQFERIMEQQLPESIVIIGFHSGTSLVQKKLLWQRLLKKEPTLIIGVHLPILLPIPNLGLIIIDEEHEVGYQEKKHPKIHTKEAALLRAKLYDIPIVLGSATPSLSSLCMVKEKKWHFFQLKKRFAGEFPTIETVFLTDKKQRKNFWISQQLETALKDRLARQEQSIIFLNRRGHSFFVQCKSCTFIFECTSCSVSLTLHNDALLTCHYCGACKEQPKVCPNCKVDDSHFLKKGIGTQQVVTILEKMFPTARIGRADLDTSTKKKVWQQTLHDFEQGNLDILVGTQTITKGFHFPRVTLVGILWADLNLHFPVYNASETTLQQLIQVAGRAGRTRPGSRVIVQAMADHPIFEYLNEIDYLRFYKEEIASRSHVQYPPCARLAEIELKNNNEHVLEKESHSLAMELHALVKSKDYALTILGPAKPPIAKIKHTYMRKIYIKGSRIQEILLLYALLNKSSYNSKIYFTPNPIR